MGFYFRLYTRRGILSNFGGAVVSSQMIMLPESHPVTFSVKKAVS